jgi:hypothetical protein
MYGFDDDRVLIQIYKHAVTLFKGSSIVSMQDGLGVLVCPPPLDTPGRHAGCPIYATGYWPDRTVTLPLTSL